MPYVTVAIVMEKMEMNEFKRPTILPSGRYQLGTAAILTSHARVVSGMYEL